MGGQASKSIVFVKTQPCLKNALNLLQFSITQKIDFDENNRDENFLEQAKSGENGDISPGWNHVVNKTAFVRLLMNVLKDSAVDLVELCILINKIHIKLGSNNKSAKKKAAIKKKLQALNIEAKRAFAAFDNGRFAVEWLKEDCRLALKCQNLSDSKTTLENKEALSETQRHCRLNELEDELEKIQPEIAQHNRDILQVCLHYKDTNGNELLDAEDINDVPPAIFNKLDVGHTHSIRPKDLEDAVKKSEAFLSQVDEQIDSKTQDFQRTKSRLVALQAASAVEPKEEIERLEVELEEHQQQIAELEAKHRKESDSLAAIHTSFKRGFVTDLFSKLASMQPSAAYKQLETMMQDDQITKMHHGVGENEVSVEMGKMLIAE